ncbi:hypothetical protein BGZ74_004715 [Mortierella antarctica]|nr:hypothetical protein BGZ74_004715 [Mortierella antarctica]
MSTAIKANANSTTTTTSQHSLRQLVRTQINEYSRLTQLLFNHLETLADGKTPPTPPNDIMKQIVQLDATLMGAVEKIELHQRQQQRIRQVRLEIEEQNKAIMAVIQSLRGAKQVLELNLENLDEKRAVSADARSGPPPQAPGSLGRDEDGDDDSSASEEEFSLYGRIQDEERRRQEEQGQVQDEEHAGDIFDLDLS